MIWRPIAATFAAALAFLLTAAPASAQATRTWVSGVGDDVNPCSRTAPCKTFAGAISKTAANGEINCLDPGGFGGVTITKSITLSCRGTQGSLLVAQSAGVTVNGAGVVVTLRNVSFVGSGTGTSAIKIINGSVIADGIEITGFAVGVDAAAGTSAVITRSHIAGSRQVAVKASGTGAKVFVGDTVITGNASGVQADGGGTVTSLGDNVFAANGSDGAFTATVAPR